MSNPIPNKNVDPFLAAIASWFCLGGLGQILLGQTQKGMYIMICTFIGSCLCGVPGAIVAIAGIIDAYATAAAVKEGQSVGENEYKLKFLYSIVSIIDKTAECNEQ